nr:helix-turn-helix domain-containing protein [uncultured Prevotella sp.]
MAEISKELEAIDSLLMEFHDRIQSGRCFSTKLQNQQMLSFLHMIANKDEGMSFAEACSYTRIPSSTFRRLVKEGKLPEGKKRKGFTEKFWYAKDLDEYIDKL